MIVPDTRTLISAGEMVLVARPCGLDDVDGWVGRLARVRRGLGPFVVVAWCREVTSIPMGALEWLPKNCVLHISWDGKFWCAYHFWNHATYQVEVANAPWRTDPSADFRFVAGEALCGLTNGSAEDWAFVSVRKDDTGIDFRVTDLGFPEPDRCVRPWTCPRVDAQKP